MGFKGDLAKGQKGERFIQEQLKNSFGELKQSQGLVKGCDLYNDIYKIEVKTDLASDETGNIGIEYLCTNVKSGISATESNIWVHIFQYKKQWMYLMVTTSELKRFIKENSFERVQGGDGNRAKIILIPITKILFEFPLGITQINT